jgi:hypothetical protein
MYNRSPSGFLRKQEIRTPWHDLADRIGLTLEATRHEARCVLRDEYGIDLAPDATALAIFTGWIARSEDRLHVATTAERAAEISRSLEVLETLKRR